MESTTDWENSIFAALAERGDSAQEMLALAADVSSRAGKPTEGWLASVAEFVDRAGTESVRPWLFEVLNGALALSFADLIRGTYAHTPSHRFGRSQEGFTIFKGLLWIGQQLPEEPELSRAIATYQAHAAQLNVEIFDWTLPPFAAFAHRGPLWEDALRLAATVSGTKPSGKW